MQKKIYKEDIVSKTSYYGFYNVLALKMDGAW